VLTLYLVIGNGTVFDSQDKHHAGFFPNFANDPVIPDAITPQPVSIMAQGLAKASRVLVCGDAVSM
jgi:hypothetical protein